MQRHGLSRGDEGGGPTGRPAGASASRLLTRRRALEVGAGAVAGVALGGLPAWARPVSGHRFGQRLWPDELPHADRAIGEPGLREIEHVVLLMLENHSADNVLGMLPHVSRARRGKFDGLPVGRSGIPISSNPDASGHRVRSFALPDLCPDSGLTQNWNSSHRQWNGGRNDGFVTNAASRTPMGYLTPRQMPVTYALASHFPVSDRFFCSVLGQTLPNRRYYFSGTSSGQVNDDPTGVTVAAAAGRLPSVSYVEQNPEYQSEENPQDIAYGETFLRRVAAAVMHGPRWSKTALFITYDEHGGWYDHVPPPRAVAPDKIPPNLTLSPKGTFPASFNRYGFRVPLTIVSPWGRPGYVSHKVSDLTSILAFIEHKWNLPPMTRRDAAAWDLRDMFDTTSRRLPKPLALPAAPGINTTLAKCRADGKSPPTATTPRARSGDRQSVTA